MRRRSSGCSAGTGLTALTPAADAPAFGRFEASRPNEIWTGDALHAIRISGRRGVSEATRLRARVAALSRPGADRFALHAARRDLATVNVRRAIDKQRAALGLPPVADDLAAVLAAAAFLRAGV